MSVNRILELHYLIILPRCCVRSDKDRQGRQTHGWETRGTNLVQNK
jgi:hypothetical protein